MGGDDEHLGAILDAISASVAYVDRDLRFRVVNAAFRGWFGDVRDKHVCDVLEPDCYEGLRTLFERALSGERVASESETTFSDGERRWVKGEYIPDFDDAGCVRGFSVHLVDITAEKRAQQRATVLAEASNALTASVDREAVEQAITRAVAPALCDWSASYIDRCGVLVPNTIAHGSSLTGQEAWHLARAFVPQPTAQANVQGGQLVVPLIARGERLAVLVLGTLKPRAWIEEDVALASELGRRASTALDLAQLFEQQRRANERLQEADRRKDDFLAIVGHELRDPLAPIVSALDVMEYSGLVGCERERAVIRRQALHMSRLVEDLLDVARIRRGMLNLEKRPVEVHTVVARAVELANPLLEQRQHHLTVNVPRELVVDGDATRLTQVFSNLLTNAAKYTDPRGQISIAGARVGDQVAVTVSDDGWGIAPERSAEIFEPFVQGEHTLQRAHGGLGLGLALVRSLTELHGGSVHVESEGPGRGARFTVRLPAYRIVIAPYANGRKRALPTLSGARLLVVDDNADAARVLADLLREQGYNVAVAHDAPAALVLADQFQPAIALLDIGLPVMDGYELARHLRARLAKPPRLVAVTGYGEQADLGRHADAGFDFHLGKPVDFDKLVSVLGTLSPS